MVYICFTAAKAVVGDLEQSEGRRLRKRPEPPKVEAKPAPTRKPSTVSATAVVWLSLWSQSLIVQYMMNKRFRIYSSIQSNRR